MLKANLLHEGMGRDRARERVFVESEFEIGLSQEQILELRELKAHELQERLNEIFSQNRREAMLAKASRDPQGRPVRYYRIISLPRFFAMLERGEDKSQPVEQIDHRELEQRISHVLERYAFFNKKR